MREMKYMVFAEEVTIGEDSCTVYGLKCVRGGQVIASVPDITDDRAMIEETAELCNRLRLDPLQLYDIAEDTAPADLRK